MKHRLLLALLITLLTSWAIVAQETSTPEIVTTEIGEISVQHPAEWRVVTGQSDTLLIVSADLEAYEEGNYPDNLLLAQLQLIGRRFVPNLTETATLSEMLAILPLVDTLEATTEEIEANGKAFARIASSDEGTDTAAYAFTVSDNTFAIVTVVTPQSQALAEQEATLLAVLASFTLTVEVPVPDGLGSAYANLPQGISEEGFPQLGNPTAPVQIYEISSFDCPACARFHSVVLPSLLPLIESGEVAFTYVPIFGTGSLAGGDSAMQGSLCAIQQGQFWPYHDLLFSWQTIGAQAFLIDRLVLGAEALGLNMELWQACLTSPELLEVFLKAFTYAQELPTFQGTPTVLVNGVQVVPDTEPLLTAIQAALTEATPEPAN